MRSVATNCCPRYTKGNYYKVLDGKELVLAILLQSNHDSFEMNC